MDKNKKGIMKILNELGVPSNYLGYNYIVEESLMILDITINNQKVILNNIDREVASKYHTNPFNIERDIRLMFENRLEVSSFFPPLGMSKMQWRTIVRESKMPNSLWFYRKTVKYKDLDLLNEVGFVIKQNATIVRKIPLEVDIISYTLPK